MIKLLLLILVYYNLISIMINNKLDYKKEIELIKKIKRSF